jgi:NAD(P)-dependent dehydrogenase (short-subunit alcohol dehydrogenase family)
MNNYLSDLFNLKGKVAVVIGGGGYLCSEMARGFARAGCAIAILDLRPEKAKAVEDDLRTAGFGRVMSLAIDVAKKQDQQPYAFSGVVPYRVVCRS